MENLEILTLFVKNAYNVIKKFHYGCGVASECIVGVVKMSEESGSYIC